MELQEPPPQPGGASSRAEVLTEDRESHGPPGPATSEDLRRLPATSGFLRWLLLALGLLFAALATVGAFLPLLPTTPFLLLATACFARSSPALRKRLLANRAFGPYLVQWQQDGTVPREAKRKAYGLLVVSFTISIVLLEGTLLRAMLAALGAGLIVFLARLPSTPRPVDPDAPPA